MENVLKDIINANYTSEENNNFEPYQEISRNGQ